MRQTAVIIDLDGTLAVSQHVNAFTDDNGAVNWTAWMETNRFSPVNEWCRDIISGAIINGHKIIFLTARNGDAHGREVTETWLKNNGFSGYELFMRGETDRRPDYIIKQELYLTAISSNYEVLYAVDDKRAVIDMWRDLGVTALHCADY